jgi:hypothetical protein
MKCCESRRVFEILPVGDKRIVRTYRQMDDGTQVDPSAITFGDPERALTYVNNMIGGLKRCSE